MTGSLSGVVTMAIVNKSGTSDLVK